MIFSNTSNYMLKYQKAKAKLVEYDIPQKDYPKFPLNSNELSYPILLFTYFLDMPKVSSKTM